MKHKPTKNQLEVLLLLTPNPIGEGLTEEQVAERLGISQSAVSDRVNTFKKNFPKAWERWQGILRAAGGNKITNPLLMSDEDIVYFERIGKIKEVF